MTTFVESRLEFEFDDNWTVTKWDEHPAYRNAEGFGRIPNASACDFLGHHASAGVYLIEVKNFTDHHHDNRGKPTDPQWALRLAAKVRDTVAAVVWARGGAHDAAPTDAILNATCDGLVRDKPELKAVFWIEDVPPVKPAIALVLQEAIKRSLGAWFKLRSVRVTSLALHTDAIVPGLVVRPLPVTP